MYVGPWIMVRKPPSSQERIAQGVKPRTLIHDDEAARAMGYKAGIVGGLTLLSVTAGTIPASLGQSWFDGGVFSVRHKSVNYEGEFRAIWEPVTPDSHDSRKIAFHLENREGSLSTYGWASITKTGSKPLPPWERNPVPRLKGLPDASPETVVGVTREPFELIINQQDVMEKDQNWWYHYASPWGDPIFSPLDFASVFYHGRRINPAFVEPKGPTQVRAGMDAGTDIVVYEPAFLGHTYIINTKVADKWQTEKTTFVSTEYSFTDKKTGKLVAVSRNYGARVIREPKPYVDIK
jgi:hypothetical protein